LPVAPDRPREEAAYRILQESISNAVRHGRPDLIQINIRSNAERLDVSVQDNGGGIQGSPEEAISLGQAGLAGMRERALALKGDLDIANEPGQGVRLVASFPLARAREPA